MTTRRSTLVVVLSACMGYGAAAVGCAPESNGLAAAPGGTDAPPAAGAKDQPLSAKALVHLDDLRPAVAAPKNPAEVDKLPPRAKEIVAEAEQELAKNQHAAAIRLLERAVGFDPENARIRRLLGRAYLGLPNRGKALANLEAAVKAAPDDLESQVLLGQLDAAQRQNAAAITRLRTALLCSAANPANPLTGEALLTLSLLLDREGYWTAALDGYNRLGDWIGQHGRNYAERASLREWVLRPARLQARQGALHMLLRQYDKAAELLRLAYQRDRTSRQTARLLVDALLALKEYDQAEKLLLEMASQPTLQPQVPDLLGALCSETKDSALPGRFWKAYREKHPLDPSLAIGVAAAAQRQGWDAQALEVLQSVLAAKADDPDLWRVLCRAYARGGKLQELLDEIDRVVKARPEVLETIADAVGEVAAASPAGDVDRQFAQLVRKSSSPAKYALLYLAGRLATAKGKHLLAADLYRQAIDGKSDFLAAYEALLESYVAQKRDDQTDRLLDQVDKLAEGTYLPAYLRGKVALSRGETRKAIDAFEQALQRKTDDLATLLMLARAYRASDQADRAVTTLLRALKAYPNEVEVYQRLFDVYAASKRLRDAQLIASRLLDRRPDSLAGRLMLAELAMLAGRPREAGRIVAELEKQAPGDPAVRLLSVRVLTGDTPGLISKADFEAAAAKLGEILRAHPGNRQARERLAELLASVGKAEEAAGIWAGLYEESRGDAELARKHVITLWQARQYAPALRALERFLEDEPDSPWARRVMLDLLGSLKQYDRARELGKAWMAEAKDAATKARFREELFRVLYGGEKYAEALDVVNDEIADKPALEPLRAKYQRVRLLALLGRLQEAENLADELTKANPDNPTPRELLLSAEVHLKKYAEALKLLDKWLAAGGPRINDLRPWKIILLAQDKQLDKARQEAEAWIQKEPQSLVPRRTLMGVLAEADKYAQAERIAAGWLKEMTPATTGSQPSEIPETLRWLLEMTVRLKLSQQQSSPALKLAEEHLKADPKNVELLGLKSTCLTELGRPEEALKVMEEALALKPEDASLNNNLGYMYAEQGVHLDKAERMLRLALQQRPGEIAFTDSLGWVLYKLGRFREAGRVFQDLVENRSDEEIEHAVILDHAGDVYCRLGWTDRAVSFWQRAIKLAKEEKLPTREVKQVLTATEGKIQDVRAGRPPKLAPLGAAATQATDAGAEPQPDVTEPESDGD